ncbi:MAG: acyltransferase family protein [Fibrobacter sp.]|nr:acyltransferase family protein [Fibrobacter sp.]
MTERNPVFDMMKGVAILLMVLGHCRISDSLHHVIYLFHIPMFFIVSGYFYKPKAFGALFKSDLKRLIFPYLIFSAVVFLKFSVDAFRLQDFSTLPKFAMSVASGNFGVGPIWFLLALFWCRELFNAAGRSKWGIAVAVLVSVAVGAFGWNVEHSLGLLIGVSAIVFYALGFLWAKKKIVVHAWMALLGVAISAVAFFGCGEMDVHMLLYPLYPLNVLGALAVTFSLYWILEWASRFSALRNSLSFLGRASLLLLGVHYTEFMLFDWYAKIPDAVLVAVLRLMLDVLVTLGLSRVPIVKKVFF